MESSLSLISNTNREIILNNMKFNILKFQTFSNIFKHFQTFSNFFKLLKFVTPDPVFELLPRSGTLPRQSLYIYFIYLVYIVFTEIPKTTRAYTTCYLRPWSDGKWWPPPSQVFGDPHQDNTISIERL